MAVEITGKNFRAFSKALLHAQATSSQTFQLDGETLNTRYSAFLIKQYGESLGYTEENLYTLADIELLIAEACMVIDNHIGDPSIVLLEWWRDKRKQYVENTKPSTERVY